MSYLEKSFCAITDSGGIQEETTYLNIPCLTLRKNTERPITMSQGANRLIEPETLVEELQRCLHHPVVKSEPPELWDGHTAGRIRVILKSYFG
jgi:UDP-N-acetylglucosamine 2-epimerase (non-hydrolysing)